MITLSKSGNAVKFTFDENDHYLQNGTIEVPVNSLALIMDDSDMVTFRKSASNDIFVSANYSEFGMSKAELEAWYKTNMVGSSGGGGGTGGTTPEEVQSMIDSSLTDYYDKDDSDGRFQPKGDYATSGDIESAVSGLAESSAVTLEIAEATSGKADSSSLATVATSGSYDDLLDKPTIPSLDGYATEQWVSGFTYDKNTIDEKVAGGGSFDPTQYYNKTTTDELLAEKLDVSAYTPVDLSEYWTSAQTESAIGASVSGKVDTDTYTAYTAATDTVLSGKANSSDVVTNVAQDWYEGTQQIYLKQTKGGTGMSTPFIANGSGTTFTKSGGIVHVNVDTNVIAQKTDIPSVSGYADSVKYNSTSKYVEFYHGGTGGTKVFEYDASPFLIDGMVQNVEIKDVTSGSSTVTCLVITFNTDAGKQDINIPISQIFDANNYYTKTETDNAITAATNGLAVATAVTQEISEAVSGKANSSDVYLKTETSGATQISDALSGKQDTLSAGTNITIVDNVISATGGGGGGITSGEVQTMIDESISGKADTSSLATVATSGSYDDLTNKPTIPTVPTSNTAFTNDAGYITSDALSGYAESSAVTEEITAAVSGKVETSAITSAVTSASTDNEIPTAKAVYDATQSGGGGGGGSNYSAGTGINISNDVISVNMSVGEPEGYPYYSSLNKNNSGTTTSERFLYNILGSGYQTLFDFNSERNNQTSKVGYFFYENTITSTVSGHTGYNVFIRIYEYNSTSQLHYSYAIIDWKNKEIFFYNKSSASFDTSIVKTIWDYYGKNSLLLYTEPLWDDEGMGGQYALDVSNMSGWDKTILSSFNRSDSKCGGYKFYPNSEVYSLSRTVYNHAKLTENNLLMINDVNAALGGFKLVKLTQSEYDNLSTKDNSTLYVIVN